MNWRTTGCVLVLALASVVWSSWSRPLDLLPSPELNLDAYSQVEVFGDTGWSMSKEGDWRTTRPIRARLSNTRVEHWIRHFDRLESCPEKNQHTPFVPPSQIQAAHSTYRCRLMWLARPKSNLMGGGIRQSVVVEPICFGLASFHLLQVVPPSFRPRRSESYSAIGSPLNYSGLRRGRFVEPSEAPADLELSRLGWRPWNRKQQRFLGVPATQQRRCFQVCSPVAAELSFVGNQSMPTRSIRFGKRLADGSRLAQVRG